MKRMEGKAKWIVKKRYTKVMEMFTGFSGTSVFYVKKRSILCKKKELLTVWEQAVC